MIASLWRKLLAWSVAAWKFSITNSSDVIFMVGLVILSYGCWRAWEPLGLIVFGGMICLPMLIHRMRNK